jgi:hypothetical protein
MLSLVSLSLLVSTVFAQSSFSPTRPPAIPLAVSNPYLNTWQQAGSDGGNGGYVRILNDFGCSLLMFDSSLGSGRSSGRKFGESLLITRR